MRILVIDNDAALVRDSRDVLTRNDFLIDVLSDGDTARHVLLREAFDLAIVDVGMPGLGGVELLRRVRREGCRAPLLALTPGDDVRHRVAVLEAGADDCLAKPVDLRELRARVRALLRRSTGADGSEIAYGPLTLDTDRHRMRLHGEPVDLRRREFCLLEVLLLHAGKIVSIDRITDYVFGYRCDGSPNAVQIYVHRLRRKLARADVSIVTVRGVGYRLDKGPERPCERESDPGAPGPPSLALPERAGRAAPARPGHERSPLASTTE